MSLVKVLRNGFPNTSHINQPLMQGLAFWGCVLGNCDGNCDSTPIHHVVDEDYFI